jgi:hypothetical protein
MLLLAAMAAYLLSTVGHNPADYEDHRFRLIVRMKNGENVPSGVSTTITCLFVRLATVPLEVEWDKSITIAPKEVLVGYKYHSIKLGASRRSTPEEIRELLLKFFGPAFAVEPPPYMANSGYLPDWKTVLTFEVFEGHYGGDGPLGLIGA